MSKALKQLLDQVCPEIGFATPTSYIGNLNDTNIKTLVAIAQRVAVLQRNLSLQKLVKQARMSLANGAATDDDRIFTYALPTDFYSLVPDTVYQFGRVDPAQLPTPPSTWAYLRSRSGPQELRVRCRFIDNLLYVFSPDATQFLDFEYISNAPIQPATLTQGPTSATPPNITQFVTDADIWLLDDPLFEMDVKWRYKREKGLDWQDDRQDYQLYENEVRARDGGAQTIYQPENWPWPGEPFTNLWVQT
jgi:hypothetical protein